jgi:hypothetical protein
MEIVDLLNEVARIMQSHDWQALTKIHTITGNGTDTAFPVAADYDRMALGQDVHDGATCFGITLRAPISTRGYCSRPEGFSLLRGLVDHP